MILRVDGVAVPRERPRVNQNYDDGLTEEQWLNAVDEVEEEESPKESTYNRGEILLRDWTVKPDKYL